MKIVVIGGTGLIGSKVVNKLKSSGHDAIAASPSKGVNTLTGEGLDHALAGADVVVDVANAPSFEDKAVLEFFETSSNNLLKAEKVAKVKHHVVLSVVGTDLLTSSGYFRAKLAQENLIKSTGIPYTIVRATQFFEFLDSIVQASVKGQEVYVPDAFLQPIAAVDVAVFLCEAAVNPPKNGILEIAGPDRFRFSEMIGIYLKAKDDTRKIIAEVDAPYFGTKLKETTLVPQKEARLGSIHFQKWFASQQTGLLK